LRLRDYGYKIGLVNEETYQKYLDKKQQYNELFDYVTKYRVMPTKDNNSFLESLGSAPIYEAINLADLLKRPEINKEVIKHFLEHPYNDDAMEQLEIKVKYEGYIQKAIREADKMLRLEDKIIPDIINYNAIRNISSESREKLNKIRPKTLGQASRISGVNPADVSVLLVYLESGSFNHDV